MRNRKGADLVLGVNVTPHLIEAVLLQSVEAEVKVVRRFIRQRKRSQEFSSAATLSTALPGLVGDDADYSLEFGGNGHSSDGAGSNLVFLPSEFNPGSLRKSNREEIPSGASTPSAANQSGPFLPQLAEILDECRLAGHGVPRLAFSAGPPDVSYVELSVAPPRPSATGRTGVAEPTRRQLLDTLSEIRMSPFDKDVVAFVPMSKSSELFRYVAIVPESSGSVPGTLEAFTTQGRALPPSRAMEAELSVYIRLARKTIPSQHTDQSTALVRVGAEDTLILFFTGRELLRFERLRSLTSYDSPDTICSRILLQQDECKIGEIHHLLVMSDARSEQLLDVFRRYYSEAAVESVQDAVTALGVTQAREVDVLSPGSIPAVIAALRWLHEWDRDDPDFAFGLLPRKLRRDQKKLAVAWHTFAMMAAILILSIVFTWRYVDRNDEIDRKREESRRDPVQLAVDNPALLRMRVDSLKAAHAKYTQALLIIDSLLVGSDRWTRLHEGLTRSTRDIGRIWLTSVEPLGGGSVRVQGTASTRTSVAQFVRRHEGSIEKATSVDIKHDRRDVTVYDFTAVIPVPSETPRVALFLQEVASGRVSDPTLEPLLSNGEGLHATESPAGEESGSR